MKKGGEAGKHNFGKPYFRYHLPPAPNGGKKIRYADANGVFIPKTDPDHYLKTHITI